MSNFTIALIVVAVVVVGGLVGLWRSRRLPIPPQDVLDRVAARERGIRARERAERGE